MSAHDQLVEMMENYIAENKKFSEKKVKAAATRARAALQEIGKAVKERRKEIIEEKNAIQMSGEKLTINENGLVTHIENNTLSVDLSAYEAIEDLQYDYSSPYVLPALSPTEDIATSNIFSMSHDIDGKMRISGDDADIEINGVSLRQTLEDIQQRMAILQPNPELEKEFKELREIRQQYIKLERNLLEKKEMWETLNKDD